MQKKTPMLIISFLFISSIVFCSVQSSSALLDARDILDEGEYYTFAFSYANDSEIKQQRSRDQRIIDLTVPTNKLVFEAEDTLNVYLLNETEMANWLLQEETNAKHTWEQTSGFEQEITYEILLEFGFEEESFLSIDGEELKKIVVFLVIHNPNEDLTRYSVRLMYENELSIFVDELFKHIVFIFYFGIGIKLMIDGINIKEDNKKLSNIYTNYGLGLFIAGIATFAWKVYQWNRSLNPQIYWNNPLAYDNIPEELGFSSTILTWITFSAVGFAIIFISRTVEKEVQQRKQPYITIALFIMQILLVIGIFIPIILVYVFYIWVGFIVLTMANILLIYLHLVKISTGIIKKKSLLIFIGLLLAFAMIALREYIRPEYISNALGTIGLIILYKGIKLNLNDK